MVKVSTCRRLFSSNSITIPITFLTPEKEEIKVQAEENENILQLAHRCDIELEGACEGSLACSTCHVILDPEQYKNMPEPSDEENDLLDLAFGLTDTSRLGCQVKIKPEMSGMKIQLPSATRNMAVDGYKPKHH